MRFRPAAPRTCQCAFARDSLAGRVPPPRMLARLLLPLLLLTPAASVLASEPAPFTAVRAADARRIAATLARNTVALGAELSDDLRYTNADGRVQTKPEYLAAVADSDARYLSVEPREVSLQSLGADGVAMTGRSHVVVESGGRRLQFALRFLAAWRHEDGRWRLAAYQSTPLPAATP